MSANKDDAEARAELARSILENPLFTESFEYVSHSLYQAWKDSGAKDADLREDIHRTLEASNRFRQFFIKVVNEGAVARHELIRAKRKHLGGIFDGR